MRTNKIHRFILMYRSYLREWGHPDPEHGALPSLELYVIATGLTQLFGHEYNLSLSHETGLGFKSFTYYPSSGLNFGLDPGDVRVGTRECFYAGGAEAGPTYISGATTPQSTECVPLPTPLPLSLLETGYGSDLTNCAFALFDFTGYEDFTFTCNVIGVASRSWGALKAANQRRGTEGESKSGYPGTLVRRQICLSGRRNHRGRFYSRL